MTIAVQVGWLVPAGDTTTDVRFYSLGDGGPDDAAGLGAVPVEVTMAALGGFGWDETLSCGCGTRRVVDAGHDQGCDYSLDGPEPDRSGDE